MDRPGLSVFDHWVLIVLTFVSALLIVGAIVADDATFLLYLLGTGLLGVLYVREKRRGGPTQ